MPASGNTGFDASTASNILKTLYEGPVREQLNSSTVLLKYVRREDKNYVGKEAYVPLHVGRNVGVGNRAERWALPSAGVQKYDKATFSPVYLYGRINLSGPTVSAAKNNAGAFVRGLSSEMKGLTRDMKVLANRQLWHDGSGVVTRCKTTDSSTSVEVESTKFLKENVGAAIEVRKISDGTSVATGRTVSSVTDADTFVISGAAITTDNTHGIFLADARDASAWGTPGDMWGLEAVVSNANPGNGLTTKFGGIDRSANLWWQSNVLDNSGTPRDLTLDLMQQAYDETEIEGDSVPGLILTNHAIKRVYANLLQSLRRYPPGGETVLDGGYRGLDFNGATLIADKDASLTLTPQSLNRIYFLTMSTFEFEVLEDFGWMDRDGSVLHWVSGYDEYEAAMRAYLNLACTRCNANTVLDDLKETLPS